MREAAGCWPSGGAALALLAVLFLAVAAAGPVRLAAQEAAGGGGPQTVPIPRELSLPESRAPEPFAVPGTAVTSAADLLAQARQLRSEGNPRDAYALYRRWLDQYPEEPEYGMILQEAAAGAPDVHLSVELYRRYRSGVRDEKLQEELLIQQARLLAAAGRTEDAVQLLAGPAPSTERLYLRGLLFYQQGELEQCLDALREALADRAIASRAGGEDGGGGDLFTAGPKGGQSAGNEALYARIYFLMAQAYAGLDRAGEAESLYLLLQKRFGGTPIAPAAYLAYAELLAALGRSAEAGAAAEELKRLFPDAPETALLASQASVTYVPTPLRLLPPGAALHGRQETGEPNPAAAATGDDGTGGTSTVTAAATGGPAARTGRNHDAEEELDAKAGSTGDEASGTGTAAAPPSDAGAPTGIAGSAVSGTAAAAAVASGPSDGAKPSPAARALVQTGSYLDLENARYMVRDLKAAGFSAEIREATVGGKTYHRVVIGPPMSWADAGKVMLHLKDAGFEGFLLPQD